MAAPDGTASFKKGDWVVASVYGLGRLGETKQIDGATVVAVSFVRGTTGWIPVDRMSELLRRPVDKTQAQRLLGLLRTKVDEHDGSSLQARVVDGKRLLSKGSVTEQVGMLHRLYRSAYKLTPEELELVVLYEIQLFGELAHVLGINGRATIEELRSFHHAFAADAPERPPDATPALESPVDLPGHAYLGGFEVQASRLAIGDPPWTHSRNDAATVRGDRRNLVVPAKSGRWHGFIESGDQGRAAKLLAVHDSRVKDIAELAKDAKPMARLIVEGGHMAILDAAVRDDETYRDATLFSASSNGLVKDRGCMSESGWGDGVYTARVTTAGPDAVLVTIDFDMASVPGAASNVPPGTQLGRVYSPKK